MILVLGRKPGQYVMIGDDIVVKVIRSQHGDLRIGIKAPRDVTITRGEIYEETDESRSSEEIS